MMGFKCWLVYRLIDVKKNKGPKYYEWGKCTISHTLLTFENVSGGMLCWFEVYHDFFILQYNSLTSSFIRCFNLQLFQNIPKLVLQSVFFKDFIAIRCVVFPIYHKAKHKLCHMLIIFWIQWKASVLICDNGVQMEWFYKNA
jgi:hypothetical protein